MHRWAQNFTVQTQEQTAKHEIIQHSASCGVETLRLFLLLQYDDWSEGSCWRLISSLKIHLLFIVPVNVKQTVSRLWAVQLSPFLGPFLSHSCLLHMTAEIYWTVDTRPPEVTDQGICCRMSFYQAIFINLEFPSQLLVYFIFLWQVRGTQTNDLPPGLLQELRTTEGWIFPLLWSTYDRLMTRPTSLILCVWPVSK